MEGTLLKTVQNGIKGTLEISYGVHGCVTSAVSVLTESSKVPASIAQSNKQWVANLQHQEWYKPLLIRYSVYE